MYTTFQIAFSLGSATKLICSVNNNVFWITFGIHGFILNFLNSYFWSWLLQDSSFHMISNDVKEMIRCSDKYHFLVNSVHAHVSSHLDTNHTFVTICHKCFKNNFYMGIFGAELFEIGRSIFYFLSLFLFKLCLDNETLAFFTLEKSSKKKNYKMKI